MNQKEVKRMINSGHMYDDNQTDVACYRNNALETCRKYNNAVNTNGSYNIDILKGIFNSMGNNVTIESNFRCEFGFNITMGNNVYINHDMIILDCNQITIGDNVYIGPRVGLYAANHAEDPLERAEGGVYSRPITIKNNVWLGGDVKIAPGVTIGENSIIGMGSVVTKNIPKDVIAGGNPCKTIRAIRKNE